jgi:hypothetical protein
VIQADDDKHRLLEWARRFTAMRFPAERAVLASLLARVQHFVALVDQIDAARATVFAQEAAALQENVTPDAQAVNQGYVAALAELELLQSHASRHGYAEKVKRTAAAERQRRSAGGKTTKLGRQKDRDARIDDVRKIAAELRLVHGDIKDEALAGFIVERRGLGEGIEATRKLFKGKSRRNGKVIRAKRITGGTLMHPSQSLSKVAPERIA